MSTHEGPPRDPSTSASGSADAQREPGLPTIDVNEYGGKRDGVRQTMNRRLFMELVVADISPDADPEAIAKRTVAALQHKRIPGVVYADALSPRGIALLTWGEDPARFVREVRPLFSDPETLRGALIRPDWAMMGRTYATGHEPDLEHVLLRRSVDNVLNEAYPWHVWYPLRRSGAFARLPPHEQGQILREHAQIGMAYGQQELAHDIRLACHGLDPRDNEFVIGLVGHDLHPLSHLVQTMRKTKQTSEYIVQMGPFFVGHVVGRSAGA